LLHRKGPRGGQGSNSGNHSLIQSPSQPPEQQRPSILSPSDSGGIQGPSHEILPPLCLESPVLREGGTGQWITQHHLAKLAKETHLPCPKLLHRLSSASETPWASWVSPLLSLFMAIHFSLMTSFWMVKQPDLYLPQHPA
jgi:hypothetical protein